MTFDEFKAEIRRIQARLILIPGRRRRKWLKDEVAKLPLQWREIALELVLTTEVVVVEDLGVKTFWTQIAIGIVCLAGGATLAFTFKDPNGTQYLFMRGLFALGISSLAVAVLVGGVHLKWSMTKALVVTATGGFAILLLFYFLNPPAPPSTGPSQTPAVTNKASSTN